MKLGFLFEYGERTGVTLFAFRFDCTKLSTVLRLTVYQRTLMIGVSYL